MAATNDTKSKVVRIEVKPEVWERAPIPKSGPIRYYYEPTTPMPAIWSVDLATEISPLVKIGIQYLHKYATSEWVEENVIRDWKTGTIYSGGYWHITTEWRWLDTPTPPKDKSVVTE